MARTQSSLSVDVTGADDLAAIFKTLGRTKDLRADYKTVSKVAETHLRAGASGGTPMQSRSAKAIKAGATDKSSYIRIAPGFRFPGAKVAGGAIGAFYGAKQFKQFPEWVGSSWVLPESGPHTFGPSMRSAADPIGEAFVDGVLRLAAERGLKVTK